MTSTTYDAQRTIEETLFNNFHQRHNSIHSPATASLASFRSMTASDLIGLLPGTPQHYRQQQARMTRNRPASDYINTHLHPTSQPPLTESEEIDEWYENIQRYQQLLEEVAEASLDETFKDELHHVNQWIRCRSDAERTAALYSIVQNASQIQIRFLIMVLQQLNQEPFGNFLTAGQDKDSLVAGSVVSTESEYERRKRRLYHRQPATTQPRSTIRISSASSEPDDLGRRGLFGGSSKRSLADSVSISGALGRQGLLHEKALAARAQIQAANENRMASAAAALAAAKSTTGGARPQSNTSPLLDASANNNASNTLRPSSSLFGIRNNGGGGVTDWPFPMTRQDRPSTLGGIGDHRSTSSKSSLDDTWSFGSLSKKKKDLMDLPSWGRKSNTIHEEQETNDTASSRFLNNRLSPSPSLSKSTGTSGLRSSLTNSLNTLELAQARLRGESRQVDRSLEKRLGIKGTTPNEKNVGLSSSPPKSPSFPIAASPSSTLEIPAMHPSTTGQFSTPPTVYENEVLHTSTSTPITTTATMTTTTEYHSDGSAKDTELTGAARRRKRSSAARALKDKIAAETVDLELMKDVQNWLRSLRLHKYGHAFIGLQWQQVIRMTDQDMIDAGVNTIGARRKLLKVFENVQRYCDENDIDY